MNAMAIAAALAVALGMTVYLQLIDYNELSQLDPSVAAEIRRLRLDPQHNSERLWQLMAENLDVAGYLPNLSNPQWAVFGMLLGAALPILAVCGFASARPLARQFQSVAKMAKKVRDGDFTVRTTSHKSSPKELGELAQDLNAMASRLEQYEREVRDSSAMLAHELRTPLNAAMGRLQGVVDGVFPHEDDSQIEMVLSQLRHINRLVGDLHFVSLARAGQIVMDMEKFSLSDLLSERIAWAKPALDEAGFELVIDIPSKLELFGDRGRIGQVLTILIQNALRHARSGRHLTVRARSIGTEQAVIEISDRGPGVALDQLPLMMDRFWRADKSRTRSSGGSGLGLAVAAAICEAHGGMLEGCQRHGGGLTMSATLLRVRKPTRPPALPEK